MIFRGLRHVPAGDERCYSPIGSRILEVLERDGLDYQEESLVGGCHYVTAVCHANTYVADALASEQKSGTCRKEYISDWMMTGKAVASGALRVSRSLPSTR